MASQSNSYMSLLINDRHCYVKKMKEIGVGECPFSLCPSKWTNDPTQCPEVSHPDIYSYLTEPPGDVLLTRFLPLRHFILPFWSSVQCGFTVNCSAGVLAN